MCFSSISNSSNALSKGGYGFTTKGDEKALKERKRKKKQATPHRAISRHLFRPTCVLIVAAINATIKASMMWKCYRFNCSVYVYMFVSFERISLNLMSNCHTHWIRYNNVRIMLSANLNINAPVNHLVRSISGQIKSTTQHKASAISKKRERERKGVGG